MQLFSAEAKIFLKTISKLFLPSKTSKVAHNPTRRPVFSPASFCFVMRKIAQNFYDAGTIAFYYVVLNYLYAGDNKTSYKYAV